MSYNDDYDRPYSRASRRGVFESEQMGDGMGMIATGGRSLWNMVRDVAAEGGADFVGKLAGAAAVKVSPKHAANVEKYTGMVVGKAIQYGANLKDVGQGIAQTNQLKNELLGDVGIFLKAEFDGKLAVNPTLALMRSDNEVIQVASNKVMGHLKSHMVNIATGLAEHAPDMLRNSGVLDKAANRMTSAKIGGEAGAQINDRQANVILENGIDYGMKTVMPWVQKNAKNLSQSKYDGETALEMIKNLAKQFGENSRGEARITTSNGDSLDMGDYIVEILKTHQKNVGKPTLTDRAHYYDEICKAAKLVAKEIQDGAMDPMALVYLVGKRKIMTDGLKPAIVREEKAEGAENVAKPADKKDVAANAEASNRSDDTTTLDDSRYEASLRKAIAEVKDIYDRHKPVDVKDFMANTAYSRKELKATVDSLQGEDRAFFMMLFPRAALHASGVPDTIIDENRAIVRDSFDGMMLNAVKELSAKDEKELHSMGFGKNDIRKLQEAGDMNLDGPDAVSKLRRAGLMMDMETIFTNVKGDWISRVGKRGKRSPDEGAEKQQESHAERVTKGKGGNEEISLAT